MWDTRLFISPVNSIDDSGSEEVRVLFYELPGDVLVGLHTPRSVVGAAVQLVRLGRIAKTPERSHSKGSSEKMD